MVKFIKGNTIDLEKNSSELVKWKELAKNLPKTWEQCEKSQEKWIKLAESQGRTYECFLYEVEKVIKSLES